MPATRKSLVAALALPLVLAGAPVHAAQSAEQAAIAGSLSELVDFLRLPNVTSRSSAEIRANAQWLEAALKRHGWQARQMPDGDTPMVWGQWAQAGPKAPTVLFYAHMDGQPVTPREWHQADPFAPVLRACGDVARCPPLPIEQLPSLAGASSDARLFARSAADDKAPILMLIAALDALKASGRKPAVNIRLIVDSHEEGGPPTLADVVERNRADLAADAVVILDGPMHPSNRPTVVFGHRGGGVMKITVFGPSEAMHSGHYGNYVPNPAQNLARLLAGMKDAQGRVTIPGYYDGATPAFAAAIAANPVADDEAALLARAGVAAHEGFVPSYRAAVSQPSLNLIGLFAGSGTALDRSIIPPQATAAFDLRTVPGIDFDRQLGLVRDWVAQQGYHLVAEAPTAQERATYPLIASIGGRALSGALFTDPTLPMARWVSGALAAAHGAAPVAIPIMGGSVPTEALVKSLHAPVILLPLANADDNQHAADENMRLGNYVSGVHSLTVLLSRRP
ncbi:MAG TPA: M20/M25/M40 family metallo-hydrolase [Novosphingobium sp.]|nr:M20/M25/M40 family metallo-hydrolase [Novosphingobium sp.]